MTYFFKVNKILKKRVIITPMEWLDETLYSIMVFLEISFLISQKFCSEEGTEKCLVGYHLYGNLRKFSNLMRFSCLERQRWKIYSLILKKNPKSCPLLAIEYHQVTRGQGFPITLILASVKILWVHQVCLKM